MTPTILLADLRRAGFALSAGTGDTAGRLIVEPGSNLSADQRAQIKEHRDSLLELLATEADWEAATSALAERAFPRQSFRGPAQPDRPGVVRTPPGGGVPDDRPASVFRQAVGGAGRPVQGAGREDPPQGAGAAEEAGGGAEAGQADARPAAAAGEHVGWAKTPGGKWQRLCSHPDRWECWRKLRDMPSVWEEPSIELLVNEGEDPNRRKRPR